MENRTFIQYLKAVGVLEAKEVLIQLKVADFPKLKGTERKSIHNEFLKKSRPKHLNIDRVLTTKEMAQKFGGLNG